MKRFSSLLGWELRRLRRNGTAVVALAFLLLAGLVAIATADREVARQEGEIAALPAHYATQMERLRGQFANGGHAGYLAYATFFPVPSPPPPLTRLALGLRDVVPVVTWVRLLGLEAQLYESGLGNPSLQALGTFDLAFVLCALVPLVLLVLLHDTLSRDRADGILPLVVVQAGGLGRLFAARVLVHGGAVALAVTALLALAFAWHRLPVNGVAFAWLGDALLHLTCWTAIGAFVAASCRTVSASLAAAGTAWVVAVVVLPTLFNLYIVAAHPVPEGLELTVRQRQEVHSGWDKPKEETFARFFISHPEWRDTPPVTERFAWKWYYAMHQVGDESVAREAAAFTRNLLARADALERLAWLAPPVATQILLSRRADTDLAAHLRHLARVREFHAALQRFFYPPIFAEQQFAPDDFATFPRYTAPAPDGSIGGAAERLPLLVTALLATALAVAGLRRAGTA